MPSLEAKLDYTMAGLRQHLERQFKRGMNWDKFRAGAIQIDHIVPLRQFDLRRPEEAQAAWAISNLQPLWSKANAAKGANRTVLL